MGISRAVFDANKGRWEDNPFTDIQAGTTQIKKVMIDGVEVWSFGVFSAATITSQGNGGFGQANGTFTFNVISSTGSGAGGQITGSVSFRSLGSISSIVDGGSVHSIGDVLTVEIVGGGWNSNPTIQVTAL